jgi:hypothetical protein
MTPKTAILVFANSPETDARLKGINGGATLFSALNEKTLATVKKTGLPFFHIAEQDQKGETFGQRFCNAIDQLFSLGYDQLITLGNDTPQISFRDILEAESKITLNTLVLGPSMDGGFYMMGLHKVHFNKAAFLCLPWQSRNLLNGMVSLNMLSELEIAFLRPLFDFDSEKDLLRYNQFLKGADLQILKLVKSILCRKAYIVFSPVFKRNLLLLTNLFNKGSPLNPAYQAL